MSQYDQVEGTNNLRPARSGGWIHVVIRTLISVLLIAISVFVCIALGRGRPVATEESGEAPRPVVEVARAVPHDKGIDFEVDGVVIPFRQIEVASEVAGRVESKSDNCRLGHTVKKGELLLEIDPQDYQLEVRRLEHDLEQSKAKLHELEVETTARTRQIELALEDQGIKKREVERYENIDDPGVYSKSEVDAARLKELQARDALQTEYDQLELLKAKQAGLASARDLVAAQLEKAELELTRTKILSPIDGVITGESVEQGGYVQRGGSVVVVQDTSRMEIRCSLHMHQMHWIWQSASKDGSSGGSGGAYQLPETPVTVTFDIGNTSCAWNGKLAYFDGAQVDQQTRMVPCRVYIDKPLDEQFEGETDGESLRAAPITLMAGMFVTVKVRAKPTVSLLRLPEIAVQPGNDVWTVQRDGEHDTEGKLQRTSVDVAHSGNGSVLVYAHGSGLQSGDWVVVSPLASPFEGTPVEIQEAR
jgi:RND family efflux transporter MFP subunit